MKVCAVQIPQPKSLAVHLDDRRKGPPELCAEIKCIHFR